MFITVRVESVHRCFYRGLTFCDLLRAAGVMEKEGQKMSRRDNSERFFKRAEERRTTVGLNGVPARTATVFTLFIGSLCRLLLSFLFVLKTSRSLCIMFSLVYKGIYGGNMNEFLYRHRDTQKLSLYYLYK